MSIAKDRATPSSRESNFFNFRFSLEGQMSSSRDSEKAIIIGDI